MMTRRHRIVLAAIGTALSLAACNSVFGFEERTFDPCVEYCDGIMNTCTDALKQYQSKDVCLTTCALLDPGESGATTGDTIACRQSHVETAATQAAADRADECSLAAFGGFHVDGSAGCADRCNLYCAEMREICPTTDLGKGDPEDCASACAALTVNTAWTANDATLKDHDNSIECRIWHLANATQDAIHCAHADGSTKCEGIAPP